MPVVFLAVERSPKPIKGGFIRMSHVVTIQTKVHDHAAVTAACKRLNLPSPTQGTAKLFSGEATGLLVQLPGWKFPAVIDTLTGTVRFDNFGGYWGNVQHLDKFIQAYSVEKVKLEAKKRGYTVSEQTIDNGSIRVQIIESS
jgi:hypothetical protein